MVLDACLIVCKESCNVQLELRASSWVEIQNNKLSYKVGRKKQIDLIKLRHLSEDNMNLLISTTQDLLIDNLSKLDTIYSQQAGGGILRALKQIVVRPLAAILWIPLVAFHTAVVVSSVALTVGVGILTVGSVNFMLNVYYPYFYNNYYKKIQRTVGRIAFNKWKPEPPSRNQLPRYGNNNPMYMNPAFMNQFGNRPPIYFNQSLEEEDNQSLEDNQPPRYENNPQIYRNPVFMNQPSGYLMLENNITTPGSIEVA